MFVSIEKYLMLILYKYTDTCIKIKNLSRQEYYDVVINLTKQTSEITEFKHCSYKSTFNLKLSFNPKEFKYRPDPYEFFRIFYRSGVYFVYHIQIKDLVHYLNLNRSANKRFVCLPIHYNNCHIQKGHVGTVTFDLIRKDIIILEPNGRHPIEFVNKLFQMLVKDINRYDVSYKFIPLEDWLLSKRYINNLSGICAISNLFLIYHLVRLSDKNELDEFLASLTGDGLVDCLETFIEKKLIN